MSYEFLNTGDSLKFARNRRQSYVATHTFTGLSAGDTFKFSIEVQPDETVYVHFAKLEVSNETSPSAYKIRSISGELSAITGGVTPDEDINEILGTNANRVLTDINEDIPFVTPFTETIYNYYAVTQGAFTIIDNTINVTAVRDLVNQPIYLENLTQQNQYIILRGNLEERLIVGGPSNPVDITVGVFYSIVEN